MLTGEPDSGPQERLGIGTAKYWNCTAKMSDCGKNLRGSGLSNSYTS